MATDIDLVAVRESIALVLEQECPSSAVHSFVNGRDPLDTLLWRQAAELGWLAIAPPEERGGLGLGAAGLALLHFELGRACAPGAFIATSVALEVLCRVDAAGEAPVANLVADVLAGGATLAISASPGVRGTAANWLLGELDAAAALIAGEADDLLLVDLAADRPQRVDLWDETRSVVSMTSSGALIAKLPGARPAFEAMFALALAADSAGVARGILERTISYMKEREQFGRPIGSFQALKHRAADHTVRALVAEQNVAQAVDYIGQTGPGARLWPAMAKANASDAAVVVAGDCVQLHGGVGFTREYDPHLYLKRARLNEMLLAPNSVLRDRAEQALGEAVQDDIDVLEIAR